MTMPKQGAVRILIVDDHAVLRKAVRRLLETRSEFEVCGEAENGLQAIKMAAESKPDVVILDIVMPMMNGFEAARKIMVVSPESRIVVLSSHKDKQLLEEARNVGAVCYVPKADAARELIDAVKAAARGRSSSAIP
jgi:DNA-binding NarL/FixJ family response regulator